MVGLSSQQTGVGVMLKNLVGLCVGLMMIISGSIAMAHDGGGGGTKEIKSEESGSFVSANFGFNHPTLSTPASYIHGEGKGSAGEFTDQAVDELAPDAKTCTVPGGVAGAGTESTLVGHVGVSRFTSGDLLFFKSTSGTACQDFSTFPIPPFPFIVTETGLLPVARVNIPEQLEPSLQMSREQCCP